MKRIVLLTVMLIFVNAASAQFNFSLRNPNKQPKQSDKSENNLEHRFYFGGGGGFGAGTDQSGFPYSYYSLLPMIGYQLDENLSIGATLTYQRYNYSSVGVSYTQYGFGPFVRYSVNPIFFQAEYDVINAPVINYSSSSTELVRSNFSRFLLGIGYALPLGSRSRVNAMAMYDLLYKAPSVFQSPVVVRVFFVY